jgi:DNA polymerase V
MSNRVMTILSQFSPEVEVYSIDEAFLKFTGFEDYDLQDYGVQMRDRVQKWTGIPISVGFAPTKALAKVANKIAKKFPERTNGSYVIDSEDKRIKALKWTKIEDVWGVGRQHAKRLQAINVKTAYDFTQLHDDWVKNKMSIVGLRLKRELQGESVLGLDLPKTKKNIATTRSFDKTIEDFDNLRERIATFASVCSEKLRKQKSCCHQIIIFIRTDRFKEERPYYFSRVITLPYGSNSAITLVQYATLALKSIYKTGLNYKKAGVIVCDLVPENALQLHLFDNENPKHKQLMQAIDLTNKKLGNTKIKLASQDVKRTWKMKQEKLSPRYTTSINEIFVVK